MEVFIQKKIILYILLFAAFKVGYSGSQGDLTEENISFDRDINTLEFVATCENITVYSLTFYDDSSVKSFAGTYAFTWWDLFEGVGNGECIGIGSNEFAGGDWTEGAPYLVANPLVSYCKI